MAIYKLFSEAPLAGGLPITNRVIKDGNCFIPFDPDNTDYQAYLKWLEEGNTPEPADQAE
jgi:hypothetical protein